MVDAIGQDGLVTTLMPAAAARTDAAAEASRTTPLGIGRVAAGVQERSAVNRDT